LWTYSLTKTFYAASGGEYNPKRFNEVYTEAYQTILFVESNFGTELRQMAMEIARERVELRKKAQKIDFFDASRRENAPSEPT
jgi:hypothetical protein